MGQATEELAARSGPGIGGLLNVTSATAGDHHRPCRAPIRVCTRSSGSLVGSILGNILLVLGASDVRRRKTRPRNASSSTAPRQRAVVDAVARRRAMLMPAIFELVEARFFRLPAAISSTTTPKVEQLFARGRDRSELSYGAGLLFSLKTHRDLFQTATRRLRRGQPALVGQEVGDRARDRRCGGRVMSEILVGLRSARHRIRSAE